MTSRVTIHTNPPVIVIDDLSGLWVAMLGLPVTPNICRHSRHRQSPGRMARRVQRDRRRRVLASENQKRNRA